MSDTVYLCINFRPFTGQPSCAFRGSKKLATLMEEEVARRGLSLRVERTRCMGHCPIGPTFRLAGREYVHEADEGKVIAFLDAFEGKTAVLP